MAVCVVLESELKFLNPTEPQQKPIKVRAHGHTTGTVTIRSRKLEIKKRWAFSRKGRNECVCLICPRDIANAKQFNYKETISIKREGEVRQLEEIDCGRG